MTSSAQYPLSSSLYRPIFEIRLSLTREIHETLEDQSTVTGGAILGVSRGRHGVKNSMAHLCIARERHGNLSKLGSPFETDCPFTATANGAVDEFGGV